ncbi:MAG: hypothetical protein KME22_11455 [Hassallia sp. WJT32-NPBG1]|jgi:hypothetical protein|nr:hypothetical protein [Hassallia sp. WJT32-NPBG1]
MSQGFGKTTTKTNKRRQFEYSFCSLMGEQIAQARAYCIANDINPQAGQSLVALATGADLEGWLTTPKFDKMRVFIFSEYFQDNEEGANAFLALEVALQGIRAKFAPRFNALVR